MNRFLSSENVLKVLENIRLAGLPYEIDKEKHRLIFSEEEKVSQVSFRLPITFPVPEKDLFINYTETHYIILLVQSGSCAIGYFENGINLDHKVYRAYMVRKKRGTSQIKHLKTKGKSRAGSRVRLAETLEFFENINSRLQEYFQEHKIDRIAMSCSKILVPFLFDPKLKTPFDKRDPRILKIPKHIHTPIYEVLLDTNKYLLKGELTYEAENQELVDQLLKGISHNLNISDL